jgi:hypothetical protein
MGLDKGLDGRTGSRVPSRAAKQTIAPRARSPRPGPGSQSVLLLLLLPLGRKGVHLVWIHVILPVGVGVLGGGRFGWVWFSSVLTEGGTVLHASSRAAQLQHTSTSYQGDTRRTSRGPSIQPSPPFSPPRPPFPHRALHQPKLVGAAGPLVHIRVGAQVGPARAKAGGAMRRVLRTPARAVCSDLHSHAGSPVRAGRSPVAAPWVLGRPPHVREAALVAVGAVPRQEELADLWLGGKFGVKAGRPLRRDGCMYPPTGR